MNLNSGLFFIFILFISVGILGCNDYDCLPEGGDEVAIYNAKYKPGEFDKAKQIHVEGFSKAMEESGQDRITYFLEDKENNEVVAISFFRKGNTVHEWHSTKARDNVLERLKSLLKEPITHEKLHVIDSHATD